MRRNPILPPNFPSRSYRLLALDVDGTLLDSEGNLRASTEAAIRDLERAGLRILLCTGRRYRKARVIAEMLGYDAPLVCNSGAIVKDSVHHRTLHRADLDPSVLADVLEVFHSRREPVVSFTDRSIDDRDFIIEAAPTGREHFDDYLDRNHGHADILPGWTAEARTDRSRSTGHYHLCGVGTVDEMLDLERAILDRVGDQVRTFVQKSPKYTGTMCEVLHQDASKWWGIVHVAKLWGIDPSEVIAVGDDVNDVPMIIGAGFGVAMGQAPDSVKKVADHVTGDHENDGVGLLIRAILENQK